METRIEFTLSEKRYCLFIERGLLRLKGITLLQLLEDPMDSTRQIPIKISTSTPKESWDDWLMRGKLYLTKQRRKKRGQCGGSNTGKRSGRNIG